MKEYAVKTRSPQETYSFGEALGAVLQGDETILLLGDMGAGKTAITRGIVAGMGIDDDVSSPTYTLVNTYEDGGKKVHHFDLYRLMDEEGLYEMGFEDYLDDEAVLIIEWPQIAQGYPFERAMTLTLALGEDSEERMIRLEAEDSIVCALEKSGW
ncbi:MAG: tRNA (adenosine(37)-N6)-threonylcarbamoyltransferase complex ATPase subunit type 1 TsaE [Eubacterium sp.]|nr:tRNA (adenosine(37)-N6)-threonylcarbamoyltransferase complex ATPase subunit type 1 TsaE [Eubacterium sp.]